MTETSFLTVAQATNPESVSLGWNWYVRAVLCLEALSLFFKVFLMWTILKVLVHLCGEGNGTPLQYSCLENPMDRRAW